MSIENVRAYLKELGQDQNIIEVEESSATVEAAAAAVGTEPARIAKTMAFHTAEGPILILAAGDVKIDNHKYKGEFHEKARMIPWDDVEEAIGHAPGGVCPYAVKEGVRVFLDESLKRFDVVYPAAGNDHSAVRQTIPDLELTSKYLKWVDVCKLR